mgnify:CR=1 FL=1
MFQKFKTATFSKLRKRDVSSFKVQQSRVNLKGKRVKVRKNERERERERERGRERERERDMNAAWIQYA